MEQLSIVNYRPFYQDSFERLNREWIEEYFYLEPIDLEMLRFPEKHFPFINCALLDQQVVGVAALALLGDRTFELAKMAVDRQHRRKRIGWKLCEKMIDVARNNSARELVLYSNTKLEPALSMYHKLGFKQIPLGGNIYKRSDIKMGLEL